MSLLRPFLPFLGLALLAGLGAHIAPSWNPLANAIVIFGALYSLAQFRKLKTRGKGFVQMLWIVSLFVQVLILVSGQAAYAFNTDDPRLGIKNVRKCVEIVETGLESFEFDTEAKETEIIKACRDADAASVWTVLNHLPSTEKVRRSQVLPIVRECKLGVGGCFEMQIQKLTSIDYADAKKALQILKKCDCLSSVDWPFRCDNSN